MAIEPGVDMDNEEITRLQAQVESLQGQLNSIEEGEPDRASRRGVFKLAAGAAVGAVAGGMLLGASPASAGMSTEPNEYFFSMTPARMYDSRWTTAASGISSGRLGLLARNTSRVIDVARGRNSSGTVTNQDFLPVAESGSGPGPVEYIRVTAITYNLTATLGTGVNYLSVSSGEVTVTPPTSAINFSANQNIANSGITKVYWDTTLSSGVGDYQIKVWCGDDVGSVHFIVDITGFYWNDSAGPLNPWARV